MFTASDSNNADVNSTLFNVMTIILMVTKITTMLMLNMIMVIVMHIHSMAKMIVIMIMMMTMMMMTIPVCHLSAKI